MAKKLLGIGLVFLLFTALMGCLLRFYTAGISAALVYGNVLHAHSHTAMMGWVYVAITTLVYFHFISKPGYRILFGVTILSVFGLLIAFILQGYGGFSIFFCCVHLICSYLFAFKVLRELKNTNSQAADLLRIALYMLVVSTLGIWGIGPAMAFSDRSSGLFPSTIQFYLHFQFNGFFYFAVLAIFFKSFKISIEDKQFDAFVSCSLFSTVLTFALPLSWYFSGGHLYYIMLLGVLFQIVAVVGLVKAVRDKIGSVVTPILKVLLVFSLSSFFLKTILPICFVYPDLMRLSQEIRSITIGYIHLLMLGMITGILIFFMVRNRILDGNTKTFKWGVYLFIFSFILTESLLFLQGAQVIFKLPAWQYNYTALALCSMPFPVAVVCWIFSLKKS